MVKLCLMASQGYLPCFAFHSQQPIRRLSQDYHPLLFGPESTQDLVRPGLVAVNPLSPHQIEQPFYHTRGLLDSNKFVSIDSAIKRRVLIDAQAITDSRLDALLFSYGIARECRSQGEILEFLSSGLSEMEGSLNLSVLDAKLPGPGKKCSIPGSTRPDADSGTGYGSDPSAYNRTRRSSVAQFVTSGDPFERRRIMSKRYDKERRRRRKLVEKCYILFGREELPWQKGR